MSEEQKKPQEAKGVVIFDAVKALDGIIAATAVYIRAILPHFVGWEWKKVKKEK